MSLFAIFGGSRHADIARAWSNDEGLADAAPLTPSPSPSIDNALMLIRERAARQSIALHATLDERL